jgi:hypothetical protein
MKKTTMLPEFVNNVAHNVIIVPFLIQIALPVKIQKSYKKTFVKILVTNNIIMKKESVNYVKRIV